jgi:hypothetical protein
MRASSCAVCRLVAIVALAATAGCSYARRPTPQRPLLYPGECSSSRGPAIADVIAAVNTGALAVLFLGIAGIEYNQNLNTTVPSWDPHPLTVNREVLVLGAASTAITAALIASTVHGVRDARACDAARFEFYLRTGTSPPLPPPRPPRMRR